MITTKPFRSTINKRYVNVQQLSKIHPGLKPPFIYKLYYTSASNGLDGVFKRIGKKILIDLHGFELWLESCA